MTRKWMDMGPGRRTQEPRRRGDVIELFFKVALLSLAAMCVAQAALFADPPTDLERFVWIGRQVDGTNPQGLFTAQDNADMAPYDTVIIARFHANFDRQVQHLEAAKIKAAHPAIRILTYFPGEQRLSNATYADCPAGGGLCADLLPPFDPDWVVDCTFAEPAGCSGGATCRSGQLVQERADPSGACVETGRWVETDNPAYRDWVAEVLSTWMALETTVDGQVLPLYDGVMFDLAYGTMRTSNRLRERLGCQTVPADAACAGGCVGFAAAVPGSPCLAEPLFDGLGTLLREVEADVDLADRLVLYNGLQTSNSYLRGLCRHDDPLATNQTPPAPDGVHNEYFCHHRDDIDGNGQVADNWQSSCNLGEDLERQWQLAQEGRWVLSKANFRQPNLLPDADRKTIGSYCYASYLLAEVEGLTSFKLGAGTAAPSVLIDEPEERGLELGAPLFAPPPADDTKFEVRANGLMVREFENHWVVVNPASGDATFTAPEAVTREEFDPPAGEATSFEVGGAVTVKANDATYLAKEDVGAGQTASCAEGLSHNRYTAGADGLDWTRRLRAASDPACCDARTECALGDECYRSGEVTAALSGADAACSTSPFGGETFGPTLYACGLASEGDTLTDEATGQALCCGEQSSGGGGVFRFAAAGHAACEDSLPSCPSGTNHNHRSGLDFGADWSSIESAADFEQFAACCNPATSCNRGACWQPGTVLPRVRDTDEVCAGRVAGGPLGFKPAIYACDASQVGSLFTDLIVGAGGQPSWCCTEREVNGHPVYVFDDPAHAACSPTPPTCPLPNTNANSYWGPDLGTDWTRRDQAPTAAYHGGGCCNPSQSCNRGGQCYAPGDLLPRLGTTHEVCAEIAPNAAGVDRPAIYRCDARNVGQTLTTPTDAGAVSYCCSQTTPDPVTGTFSFLFEPGAC
ncbi:MAG: hypothetical protein AAGM22_26820 [Acidobacteriota bacterium]